jgi:hypothetical protein
MKRVLPFLALVAACSSGSPSAPLTPTFVVKGAPNPLAGVPVSATRAPAATALSVTGPSGDPASITIGVYALWVSANADCSSPELVQDYGTTAQLKDFLQAPTLFTGSPTIARATCVALKISDVIHFKPATTFSACTAGTDYAIDIYRSDNTDSTRLWRDVTLATIAASGTDSLPVDNRVTLVLTRDTTAAYTRGFGRGQVLPLGADLVIPGQATFLWGGSGTVDAPDGVHCGLEPGLPTFQ